jgi:hypothetical protein
VGQLGRALLVQVAEGPNEELAILADGGKPSALLVELAEPDLLLVAAQGREAMRRKERLGTLVVLE